MGYLEIVLITTVIAIIGYFKTNIIVRFMYTKLNEGILKNIVQLFLTLGFLIVLIGMTGSLYFSEVMYFEPCKLCWFQRIFMYPQVIILMIAMIRKDYTVALYTVPLSLIGTVFGLYQYAVQMGFIDLTTCGIDTVACGAIHMKLLGFITIPFLSVVGFIISGFFVYLAYQLHVKLNKHFRKEVT